MVTAIPMTNGLAQNVIADGIHRFACKKRGKMMDFDDAYANIAHIANADRFVLGWPEKAAAFRDSWPQKQLDIAYGNDPRHCFDLFLPKVQATGLVVFLHGGYWRAFAKDDWSHLAAGALSRGFAVALPSYRLAPQAALDEICQDVAVAVAAAANYIDGPIHLVGHSAGGHLVTRLISGMPLLSPELINRIVAVTSISGVHDLRPLLFTKLNELLAITDRIAITESPTLLVPLPSVQAGQIAVSLWVGAEERPEFLRQTDLLAVSWGGLGVPVTVKHEKGRHHFDVIDGLAIPTSNLIGVVLGNSNIN